MTFISKAAMNVKTGDIIRLGADNLNVYKVVKTYGGESFTKLFLDDGRDVGYNGLTMVAVYKQGN